MSSIEKIRELCEPLLLGTGLQLWDVEMSRGVVRILVDREGGVDLDALTAASNALSGVLDDHPDVTPSEAYQLEVSSPGVERTLRTPAQYRQYLHQLVSIKTSASVDGQRRWRGVLVAVEDDGIEIAPEVEAREAPAAESDSVRLRYDQIDRTRTVLVWGGASQAKSVNTQAGGPPRWSDPRGKGGARRAARPGAEVKETP